MKVPQSACNRNCDYWSGMGRVSRQGKVSHNCRRTISCSFLPRIKEVEHFPFVAVALPDLLHPILSLRGFDDVILDRLQTCSKILTMEKVRGINHKLRRDFFLEEAEEFF